MEDDGEPPLRSPSPPTPIKVEIESEEPKESVKDEDPSEEEEEEFKQLEEEEEEELFKQIEDEDEDDLPPSPSLLLDMIDDLPPSSPLPPTPPIPSSPRDLIMGQQDSEDEGPPPGWDNKCELKEQAEQLATPVAVSTISSDIKTEDVQQDAQNEDGSQPQVQVHTSPAPELVSSDIENSDVKVEQEDSEDEGPPPGWDSKCQPEPELQVECQTTLRSDIKIEDVQQDAREEDVPQPQVQEHTSPTPQLVPSDVKVEQEDSEDDGPPPGWDSKCQLEPELQMECQTTLRSNISDIKTGDLQQNVPDEDVPQPQVQENTSPTPQLVPSDKKVEQEESEDEGPPPGWDSKCLPEPELQVECRTTPRPNIKTEDLQQDARDEDGPHQSQAHELISQAPELVPSDIKEEKEDSEDEGPPPGWDSKCQPEPELQMEGQTTSRSGARMGCEQNNVKVVEERLQQPSRQPSIPPTKPQISAPKPPTTVNNPEMGQMVCGSCRRLLSYPRGARYVECACCLEENYVLEEHEVGQVICEGCDVLLMYPYGAPKVRCANCRTETEIVDQNRRPPLSEQRRRAKRHLKRMQPG